VEALAIAIRQNPDIKGIVIGKEETKVLQYGDDTTLAPKTEGMWIGSLRGKMEEPFSIKWPKTPIKALGVYFKYDPKLLKEKNFIKRLDSIKKLINIRYSRGRFSLWKSNNNQILLDLEDCLCLGTSSFSVVTLMSKILIYPLHSTTNFCNNGGQNLVIPLLKKTVIKPLFGTIKE